MQSTDMSLLAVTGIEMVVYLAPDTDTGFTAVEGMLIKRFGPRRYHGIVFKPEGSNRYVVENTYTLDLHGGDVLYLPQGRPYIVQSGHPGGCYCVNFYVLDDTLFEPFVFTPRNVAKWQELFVEMARSWTYRRPGYHARCHALLYEMLCLIEEDRQARYLPARHVHSIRQAMRRFEDLPDAEDASIPGLAAACGMSETYFRRLFHELYGVSPKKYILEARFRRAKALLESSDATVARIAETCGFDNIYHFSRAFRQHEGVSPTEYRSRRR